MKKGFFFQILLMVAVMGMAASALTAEKIRVGASIRVNPLYVLPILAAQDKGIWKSQGLEADYLPFKSGSDMHRAVAAGSLDMGVASAVSVVQAISRGLPETIVADMGGVEDFFIWVPTDSRLREPKDLKGTKIAIGRFGGLIHTLGLVVAKSLNIEKEMTLVAAGGTIEQIAAMKAGGVDGTVENVFDVAPLRFKGEIRPLLAIRPLLPKEWTDLVIYVRKDWSEKRPDLVKKAVRAVLLGADAVLKDEAWALAKMRSAFGFVEGLDKMIYGELRYGKDGRINPKGIENVRAFLIQYGIIAADKAPAVEKLYSREFID